jgi:hypothetical protein
MITLFYIGFFLDGHEGKCGGRNKQQYLQIDPSKNGCKRSTSLGNDLAQQLKGIKNSLTTMKVPQNSLEIL